VLVRLNFKLDIEITDDLEYLEYQGDLYLAVSDKIIRLYRSHVFGTETLCIRTVEDLSEEEDAVRVWAKSKLLVLKK
jgi:hypothetical protein